jgi:O-antigen/teichoic acid export membrane protein
LKRQFFRHGAVYAAANLIASGGSVLLVPIYTHALAPAEYGVVDYVTAIQNLVLIAAGLELTQGIARFYAAAADEEERRAYASTGLLFLIASFALVNLVLYGAARLFGTGFLGVPAGGSVLAMALLAIFFRLLLYALQGQARWELRSDIYTLASVVSVVTTVALVAYLLFVSGAGLAGVFAGLAGGSAAACVLCLLALRTTYRLQFDAARLRQMLRFSLPLTVSTLALFFAAYGDRLIVRGALGFHELGVYGIGARIAAVITLALNGFQLGAAPLIYRHHADPEAPASLAQLLRLFTGAALIGVAALAAFSLELVRAFASPEYARASPLVPLLALAIVFANMYVFVPGLTIHHMTARFARINIGAALVSLVAVALLVRVGGTLGAAFGTLAGAVTAFALHARASQQVYPMPIDWSRLVTGIAITAGTIGVAALVSHAGGAFLAVRGLLFVAAAAALVAVLSTRAERALAQRAVAMLATSSWSRA